MRTSTRLGIVAVVSILSTCGPSADVPTTEEIAVTVVSVTVESGDVVAVDEPHTALCSREPSHIHCISQTRSRLDPVLTSDFWGKQTEYSADVYCALDLTITECERYSEALFVASDHWGNYSPVSLYAVGTDRDAALELVDVLCDQPSRRKNQRYKYCVELHSDASHPQAIEYLRSVGSRAIESAYAEWEGYCNCNRGWSTFEIFMSVNWGYLDEPMFGESLADAHEHIFHEYFHVVQNSHLSSPEKWEMRKAALGPRWFHEGAAMYMSLLIPRELMESHKLDSSLLHPDTQSPFAVAMAHRLKNTKRIFGACKGGLLDTNNNEKCGSGDLNAAYSGGAWAHAYLAHKHGADRLLEVFYPNLEEMGFEEAFIYTYGQELMDFYIEFDEFLQLPLDDQLAILPEQEDSH